MSEHSDIDIYEGLKFETLDLQLYRGKLAALKCRLRESDEVAQRVQKAKDDVHLQIEGYKLLYQRVTIERQWRRKITTLKDKIKETQRKLDTQISLLAERREALNKKKDDVNALQEHLKHNEESWEVWREEAGEMKGQLKRWQRVCVARRTKVLYTLGCVFFNDDVLTIFTRLAQLNNINAISERMEMRIADTLGFVVLFGMKLSKYLCVPLAFPMTYAGPRSLVKSSSKEDMPLFFIMNVEKTLLNKGIELLVQNFVQLASYCGIDYESKYMHDPNIHLVELILLFKKYLTKSIIYES